MTDREKVIKALQICSVQNDVGCQGCPYFEERKTYGHEWCTTSMAQDALALLKEQDELLRKLQKDKDKLCLDVSKWKHKYHDRPLKEQEAIEPIYIENPYTHLPVSYCPKCREPISKFITGNPYKETKYCHYCGQEVRWE